MLSLITTILIVAATIYFISLLIFIIGLFFPRKGKNQQLHFLSIVIAMKNEEENLPYLLEALNSQDYPRDRHEIILVDNESSDNSTRMVQEFIVDKPHFRLLSTKGVQSPYSHKKAALDLGIRNARGEIIVTTDADCLMDSTWLSTINSYFERNVDVVVGFSSISYDKAIFKRLQALDFLMLMGAAQGTLNLGLAWACSGQNLAYRKELFQRVGGFTKVVDRLGGDDSLLLHVMKKQATGRIIFASDKKAWVKTRPESSLKNFLIQRIRWASESAYIRNLDLKFFLIIAATFLANLAPLLLMSLEFMSYPVTGALIYTLFGKLILEAILMWKSTGVYQKEELRKVFPIWFLLQMPYIVIMGILSSVGNQLPWKGSRRQKRRTF